jgi:hypothetical protein
MDRSNRPHTLRGKKVVQEKLKQQGLARRNENAFLALF